MPNRAVVAFPAAIFVGENFLVLELLDYLGHDRSTARARLHVRALSGEQDFGKSDFSARFGIELLDVDDIALCDAVLFAAGFEDW